MLEIRQIIVLLAVSEEIKRVENTGICGEIMLLNLLIYYLKLSVWSGLHFKINCASNLSIYTCYLRPQGGCKTYVLYSTIVRSLPENIKKSLFL